MALLIGEPAADEVAALLRAPGARHLCATGVTEAIDVLVRLRGRSTDAVAERLDWLLAAGLEVADVNDAIARDAGRIRAERYDRAKRPLSLADCIVIATARALGEPIATSDPPLATAALAEGCPVVGLQDARGRRPA